MTVNFSKRKKTAFLTADVAESLSTDFTDGTDFLNVIWETVSGDETLESPRVAGVRPAAVFDNAPKAFGA